jgi:SAM-dependent methyltransferase
MQASTYYQKVLGVRFYDLFSADAAPVKGDVEFYIDCARRFGSPVLELASGTGRVLWPIAAAGFEIAGIDLSEEMLALARAKGAGEPPATRARASFHRMDMASFELTESFRPAIVPFRAFQHLTSPEDQRRALNCVSRSLTPRGHLVIDLFDPRLERCVPGATSLMPERRVKDEVSGHAIVRRVLERINDPVRQRFTERLRIEELDETGQVLEAEETSWSLRWSTRQEMRYLFELTGFEVVAEYSDFFGSPPAYGAEQLWITRKL